MDAVEYVKQRRRMCDYYVNCGDCPACDYEWCSSLNGIPKMVPIVEQWVKEHPAKTRQSEFLKMFPNARIDDGVIFLGPCAIDKSHKCTLDCKKCCRDYWLKEIE